MPLNNTETKSLLVNLFRLSLSLTEKRPDDALEAYSNILDVAFSEDVPKVPEIDLIISEIQPELPSAIHYEPDSSYPMMSITKEEEEEVDE